MAGDNLKGLDGRYFGRDAAGYHRAFTGLKAPELKIGAADSELSVFGANAVQTMLTGSTGTQIKPAGYVSLAATAAKDFGMAGPVPGVEVTLINNGGTTLAQTVTLAAGTILTTVGSSANKVSMDNPGNVLKLIGLTTALFGLLSKSTASVLSTA